MGLFKASAQFPATGFSTAVLTGTVTTPAGLATGDIGYAAIGWASGVVPTFTGIPAGWTAAVTPRIVGTSMGVAIYRKTYAVGDADFTFTASGSATQYKVAAVWLDHTVAVSVDVQHGPDVRASAALTTVLAGYTAAVAGEAVLDMFLERSSTATPTTVALSAGTPDLFFEDGSTGVGTGMSFSFSERVAGSTSVAAVTATYSNSTSSTNGMAFSVAFTPVTVPTVAAFTYSNTNLVATVNGSTSTPGTGATITGYAWTYGDGGTATGATPASHTYALAGTYTVTLAVTDSNSATVSVSHSITVTAALSGTTSTVGQVVTSAGLVVTPQTFVTGAYVTGSLLTT